MDGQLWYTRSSNAKELWPAPLEKAIAKKKGGYDKLDKGGVMARALEWITGEKTKVQLTQKHPPEELFSLFKKAQAEGRPMVAAMRRNAKPGELCPGCQTQVEAGEDLSQ